MKPVPRGSRLALLTVAALVAADLAYAQSPVEFDWLRQFGSLGPASDTVFAVAGGGGAYIGGGTQGTFPGETSAGNQDGFVRKYDDLGNEVWTRQIGSSQHDEVRAIATHGGAVYVGGVTSGTLPGQTSAGAADAFISRYDPDGTLVWARQFGTSASDVASAVGADESGVYVGGRISAFPSPTISFIRKYDHDGAFLWQTEFTTGSLSQGILAVAADGDGLFVGGGADLSLFGEARSGVEDAFISRFDSATGDHVWTRQFGTSLFDRTISLALHAGHVYGAGALGITGPNDGFVRAYDRNGGFQWYSVIPDAGGHTHLQGVAADASGVYVTGLTTASLGAPNAGGVDVFTRKYPLDGGSPLWTVQLGSPDLDQAYGAAATTSGVVVGGWTRGRLPGLTGAGSDDAFLVQYSADGEEEWLRQFGAFTLGFVSGNSVDADGSAYVAGAVQGFFPGETSAGNQDGFVRKYDDLGNEVWTTQFGTASRDQAEGVFVDAGAVYVSGVTTSSSPRFVEAFVLKLDARDGSVLWERRFITNSTFSFGPGATGVSGDGTHIYVVGGAYTVLPGQTESGAFVRKYDLDGAEVWTRQFGTGGAAAKSVDVDILGVYVAGETYETLPGQTSAGGYDAFVRKYDFAGSEAWTTQFGAGENAPDDFTHGVSVDASGVYVAGAVTSPYERKGPAFVTKLDLTGGVVWRRELGDPANVNEATGAAADDAGAYVVGYSCQAYSSSCEAFIVKLDTAGNERRSRVFGTDQPDDAVLASGVSAGPSGLYMTGSISSGGLIPGTLPGAQGAGGAFLIKVLTPAAIEVAIDVKPGSDVNCFNNNGRGVIPVAILSSAGFDATQVDPATVTLDGQGVRVVGRGVIQAHADDVNGDGLNDLVLQIEDLDGTYTAGNTVATLEGQTVGGTLIEGRDSICIVP